MVSRLFVLYAVLEEKAFAIEIVLLFSFDVALICNMQLVPLVFLILVIC